MILCDDDDDDDDDDDEKSNRIMIMLVAPVEDTNLMAFLSRIFTCTETQKSTVKFKGRSKQDSSRFVIRGKVEPHHR